MDLDSHTAWEKPNAPGHRLVVNPIDRIDFDKMISGSQGADLIFAALLGPVADHGGIGARQIAAFFGVL